MNQSPLLDQLQLARDFAELRERETNLRMYEDRLRKLQADPPNTEAMTLAWDKFYRANRILVVEQAALAQERRAVQTRERSIKLREEELVEKEARYADWSRLLTKEAPKETPAVQPPAGWLAQAGQTLYRLFSGLKSALQRPQLFPQA